MALVPIVSKFENIGLFILGGAYNKETETNVERKTCEDAKQYVVDLYFILLDNNHKIGTNEFFSVCALDALDIIITELPAMIQCLIP